MLFPEEGLVYDYQLNDAGISSPALEEDEEEELKNKEVTAFFWSRISKWNQLSDAWFGSLIWWVIVEQ